MGGGRRGVITSYSAASRRRILNFVNSQPPCPPYAWVHLTYPDEYNPAGDEVSKHLNKLGIRLRRRYPASYWLWRIEWQRRKSGRSPGSWYPHIHMIGYRAFSGEQGEVKSLIGYLSRAWWEVCGKLSDKHLEAGTSVQSVSDVSRIVKYIAKYVAKGPEGDEKPPYSGRQWGVWGRKNIPDNVFTVPIEGATLYRLRRQCNRYVSSCMRRGRFPRKGFRLRAVQGITAYMTDDSAYRLVALAMDDDGDD